MLLFSVLKYKWSNMCESHHTAQCHTHQFQTECSSVCWGIMHCTVALFVSHPRVSIVPQHELYTPDKDKDEMSLRIIRENWIKQLQVMQIKVATVELTFHLCRRQQRSAEDCSLSGPAHWCLSPSPPRRIHSGSYSLLTHSVMESWWSEENINKIHKT